MTSTENVLDSSRAELIEVLGKVPETAEERDAAVMTLINGLAHDGWNDAEKARYQRLRAALKDLGPLPYSDPAMLEALRILGPFEPEGGQE